MISKVLKVAMLTMVICNFAQAQLPSGPGDLVCDGFNVDGERLREDPEVFNSVVSKDLRSIAVEEKGVQASCILQGVEDRNGVVKHPYSTADLDGLTLLLQCGSQESNIYLDSDFEKRRDNGSYVERKSQSGYYLHCRIAQ